MTHCDLAIFVAFGLLFVPDVARAAEPTKLECIAANDAAQDLRRAGKLRDAREKLALCVSMGCPGPVREDCAQRLAEVDRIMPSVVFEVKDAARGDVVGASITIDGRRLEDKLTGQPVQMDPGQHQLIVEADGVPPLEKTIVVREGERDRHEPVVLARSESTPPPAADPSRASAETWSAQRTLALGVAGAGIVGLAVGSGLGISAISKNNASNANGHCDASGCDPTGVTLRHEALNQATASTIVFALGLGAAAAGIVLWATAPPVDTERRGASLQLVPAIGPAVGGLMLHGGW